ncbi:MAG: PH domain-containing protein [Roseiflexus sp.]|nr:PH domain-containing protein [Roseiflexus sp.]MCS7290766.1 PH domain-containing protein [Roseiflexus sp.]MDW8231395.1 PH domain-containing protein [Roseiflexaceae bacterium]
MSEPKIPIPLELEPDEQLVLVGKRHWIELLQSSFVFLVIGAIAAALALIRAVGVEFFYLREGVTRPLTDPINIALSALLLVLVALWARGEAKKERRKPTPWRNPDIFYAIAIFALGVALWFRFSGGELIVVDPTYARPGDAINIVLIVTALVMLLAVAYLYNDWRNDVLIVTNKRVIYDEETTFIRHVRQQILIEDIQQVNVRADTYQATIFKYGKIIIRSLSLRTIEFDFAAKPREIEKAIMDQVRNLRRRQEPDLLRTLIEDQVYGNKQPQPSAPSIQVRTQRFPIPALYPPNPEIFPDRIVWRPSWVYVMIQLLRPLGGFAVTMFVLAVLVQFNLINGVALALLVSAALLFFGGWGWWIREALIHDNYILTRTDIIDVDRRPLGPENMRRAQLSAIQNISFDVSFVERLLGLGTVVIETGGAAGGKFTFDHVPDPRGVQATINDYLTDFRKHEKERQLQDAIALLKQYDLVQREHGEKMDRVMFEKAVEELIGRSLSKQSSDRSRPMSPNGAVYAGTEVRTHLRWMARQARRRAAIRALRERMRRNNHQHS